MSEEETPVQADVGLSVEGVDALRSDELACTKSISRLVVFADFQILLPPNG